MTRLPTTPLLTLAVAVACLVIILAVFGLVMAMDPIPQAA